MTDTERGSKPRKPCVGGNAPSRRGDEGQLHNTGMQGNPRGLTPKKYIPTVVATWTGRGLPL